MSQQISKIDNARRYLASVMAGEVGSGAALLHLSEVLKVVGIYEDIEQRAILAEIEATEYLAVGDEVLHIYSGWTGIAAAFDKGRVTVDPVVAGGKQWNAITVDRGELRKLRDAALLQVGEGKP